MNFQKDYNEISKLPTSELCEIMAGREEIGSKANFAKFIYEERQMAKQLRWIKFSIIVNAIAILAAVVLGVFLQELKSYIFPKLLIQQSTQSQIAPVNAAFHSEKTNDKVPLQPPMKGENQNKK
jgi:hypothetical protein